MAEPIQYIQIAFRITSCKYTNQADATSPAQLKYPASLRAISFLRSNQNTMSADIAM